ncbi:DUF4873 domain-containing protein [Streptacidiphilus sp. P02-A3a]|uniref:DUF4873 domain-containing protein n=1 Tax=Streptacidiphilus sp. P02-A3a TaxID=2704468 RepID=UPI0015FDBEF8|nr:DUF4873 domain-containing protein [Streptacidiphilus sp. P02-A3a]QMU69758.1 DUF4873 domain-containing protein [Streptacidiphilus sp. P02-A3a]
MKTSSYDGPATVLVQGGEITVHVELTGEAPVQGVASWQGEIWAEEPDEDFGTLRHAHTAQLRFPEGGTGEFRLTRVVAGAGRVRARITGKGPIPF